MGIVFLSPLLIFSCDSKFTTWSVSTSHLLSLRILIVQYSLNNAGRRSRGLFTLNTFNPPSRLDEKSFAFLPLTRNFHTERYAMFFFLFDNATVLLWFFNQGAATFGLSRVQNRRTEELHRLWETVSYMHGMFNCSSLR